MLPKSLVSTISEGYDKAWRAFIQPERVPYHIEALGPKVISLFSATGSKN